MSLAGSTLRTSALITTLTLAATACIPTTAPPSSSPQPTTTTTSTVVPVSRIVSGRCGTATASSGLNESFVSARSAAATARHLAAATPNAPDDLVVTSLDGDGRPVITTITATTPTQAARAVTAEAAEVTSDGGGVVAVEPAVDTHVDTTNDPGRPNQWGLDSMNVEAAWTTTQGGGVCVAVLDTGVQTTHPDLAAAIAGTQDFSGDGVNDVHGHGTHVAGIIAAQANNGVGVAGVAPGASLLIGKVLGNSGYGTDAWAAAGIVWAVDSGARVINLSLGSSCPQAAAIACQSAAMQTALNYAQSHDVIVVAAAGNSGASGNNWSWPAAFDWPIAVAAVDWSNNRASFSTQGSYVDLAAPGVTILSTYLNDQYTYMSGTSMATPAVSAVVALVRAAHPTWDAATVKARLAATATDLGTPGVDDATGAGLVNPTAAVAP